MIRSSATGCESLSTSVLRTNSQTDRSAQARQLLATIAKIEDELESALTTYNGTVAAVVRAREYDPATLLCVACNVDDNSRSALVVPNPSTASALAPTISAARNAVAATSTRTHSVAIACTSTGNVPPSRLNLSTSVIHSKWSGQRDSNSRPPAPKAGALPG